jgi:flagellar hook-associated protein 1 FlgK
MSIGSILNSARQGMNAQQTAVQIASQNIANAKTEGYSRQRVELAAQLPTIFPYGSVGTGVAVASITRARDALLDNVYRTDNAGASGAQTTTDAMAQVQSIFGEPSDTGLSAALDAFWSSWSDLASDPTNVSAKGVVRQAGNTLANTLNRFAQQLDAVDQSNREAMNADVNQVNTLSAQIADVNRRIVAAESGGQSANDLRDQRDLLLDQMTKIVGGQVIEHSNGSVAVYAGGHMIVDDTTVKQLEMHDGEPPPVSYKGSTASIDGIGGTLGAHIDVSANRIPMVMSKLDAIASGLVTTVNAIHSGGTVYSGNPPVGAPAGNFFEVTTPAPTGTDPLMTARGIKLASTLVGANDVAASSGTATGPGNNDVATQLAALRSSPVTLSSAAGTTTATISDFFNETIGSLATDVREAQDNATVQGTLAANAQTRRESVYGVSTDEELISVIEHQHAYQAAARLVQVVSDMTDALVNLGR